MLRPALNMLPSLSSSPDRKTSRTALLFLRSSLSTAFLALFLSRGSQRVCVCVRVCVWRPGIVQFASNCMNGCCPLCRPICSVQANAEDVQVGPVGIVAAPDTSNPPAQPVPPYTSTATNDPAVSSEHPSPPQTATLPLPPSQSPDQPPEQADAVDARPPPEPVLPLQNSPSAQHDDSLRSADSHAQVPMWIPVAPKMHFSPSSPNGASVHLGGMCRGFVLWVCAVGVCRAPVLRVCVCVCACARAFMCVCCHSV